MVSGLFSVRATHDSYNLLLPFPLATAFQTLWLWFEGFPYFEVGSAAIFFPYFNDFLHLLRLGVRWVSYVIV